MPALQMTPDWKLKAFFWLPLAKWDADKLLNQGIVDGKVNCKICDGWVSVTEKDSHIDFHIKEENDRREKAKEVAAEAARERREFLAAEKKALKESEAINPPKERKARVTNTVEAPVGRKPKQDNSEVVSKLEAALKNAGRATVADLANATGLDLAVVRVQVKNVPGIKVVDHVKTGGRGRPANIFGLDA